MGVHSQKYRVLPREEKPCFLPTPQDERPVVAASVLYTPVRRVQRQDQPTAEDLARYYAMGRRLQNRYGR